MKFEGQFYNTNVGAQGQFRLEVPFSEVAIAKGTSDSSVDRGGMTLIVSGSLEKLAGSLT